MCGIFLCCSQDQSILDKVETASIAITDTIRSRGPDHQLILRGDHFVAIHTLLSMTGGMATQPIVEDSFVLAWNGEIYNDWRNYRDGYGDTQYLATRIRDEGVAAFQNLDGEFAIACLHRNEKKMSIVSDPFGTKPLYYLSGDNWCATATYPSTLLAMGLHGQPTQTFANQKVEFDIVSGQISSILNPLWAFDFSKANQPDYDGWAEAFREGLLKRTGNVRHPCFVSLSAGFDSGLIAAELLDIGTPFACYTAPYLEDPQILQERIQILKNKGVITKRFIPSNEEYHAMQSHLQATCEDYKLLNHETGFLNFTDPDMRNLSGYVVSAMIHRTARKEGRLIGLSGQGADEIIADYFKPPHNPSMSDLKGNWAMATKPWANFNSGWNRAFLGASERIAGLFGIETRYPFLDTGAVQAFLDLSPTAKGARYKAPIEARLLALDFPIWDYKQGFAGAPTQGI